MGVLEGFRIRKEAMQIGMKMMAEGILMKSPSLGGLMSYLQKRMTPVFGLPPKRNVGEWLEAFGKSPRLNVVHRIAEAVAQSEWGVYNGKGDKRAKVENHPLVDLLNNPNPSVETTGYLYMYMISVYWELVGEAFLMVERGNKGQPSELWIIPPNWVIDTPSVQRPHYTVAPMGNLQGTYIHIAVEDMIYLKNPDITNPYGRGKGRAMGIGVDVETDEQMARFNQMFFYNDARPGMIIAAPGIHRSEQDRFLEQYQQEHGGAKNAHKPLIMPSAMEKVEVLKTTAQEMDFVESRRFLRDSVNQHWGVPPEIMGIIESSNRATIDAADYIFKSHTVSPRLKMIQDCINNQLVPQFGDNLFFEFDDVVPEDKEFQLKIASEGLKIGALTVNKWLRLNGLEEEPDGDVYLIPNTSTVVSSLKDAAEAAKMAREQPKEPTLTIAPEKPKKAYITSTKCLSNEQVKSIDKSFLDAARKHESDMEEAIRMYFGNLKKSVLNRFDGMFAKSVKAEGDAPQENADDIVSGIYHVGESADELAGIIYEFSMRSAEEVLQVINDTFGFGVSFDLIRPEMLTYQQEYGSDKVKGIEETTIRQLRSSITEGISEGESIPEIRKRITQVMDDASEYRATVIARTETQQSVNVGTFATYKQAEVERKEWLATSDSRTRDSHIHVNREVRNMDEHFSNGLLYPLDPAGKAREVIQCRCTLLPVLE